MALLFVTMTASALASGLAIGYRRYEFWRFWTPRRFRIGIFSYLAANGLVGAVAVVLASLLAWKPFGDQWLLNAIAYATAGQALLRVEPRGFSIDRLNSARSLLARSVDFIVEMLDSGAERSIQRTLDTFRDGQLIALALYLHARYVQGDKELPKETKDLLMVELAEAGEKLSFPADQPEARGTLERFCLRQLFDRQLLPEAAKDDVTDSG